MAVKNTMVLTYHQVSTIASALRVAADQYADDARVHGKAPPDTLMSVDHRRRLVEQFEQQAVEARELADRLEQADSLSLAA